MMPLVDLMQLIWHDRDHPSGFRVQRVGYLTGVGNRVGCPALRPKNEIKRSIMMNIVYIHIAYSLAINN